MEREQEGDRRNDSKKRRERDSSDQHDRWRNRESKRSKRSESLSPAHHSRRYRHSDDNYLRKSRSTTHSPNRNSRDHDRRERRTHPRDDGERKERRRRHENERAENRLERRKESDETTTQDALASNLPPEILQHILYFLTTEEANKLCGMWNKFWRYQVCYGWQRVSFPAQHFQSEMQLVNALTSVTSWAPNIRGMYFYRFCTPGVLDRFVLQSLPSGLRELSLKSCAITDTLLYHLFPPSDPKQHTPSAIGHTLPHLTDLDLSATFVSAKGLRFLPDTIKKLNLSGCSHVNDNLFGSASRLPASLEDLNLGYTAVTSVHRIPATLKSLTIDGTRLNVQTLECLPPVGLEELKMNYLFTTLPTHLLPELPSTLKRLELLHVPLTEKVRVLLPDSVETLVMSESYAEISSANLTSLTILGKDLPQCASTASFYSKLRSLDICGMKEWDLRVMLQEGLVALTLRHSVLPSVMQHVKQIKSLKELHLLEIASMWLEVFAEIPNIPTLTIQSDRVTEFHVISLVEARPLLKLLRLDHSCVLSEHTMDAFKERGIRVEFLGNGPDKKTDQVPKKEKDPDLDLDPPMKNTYDSPTAFAPLPERNPRNARYNFVPFGVTGDSLEENYP